MFCILGKLYENFFFFFFANINFANLLPSENVPVAKNAKKKIAAKKSWFTVVKHSHL